MYHVADNIEFPEDNFKLLLKLFSMFNIRIIYDDTIDNEDVPEAVGIMYINCGNIIGGSLENKKIEKIINPFVTNMVLQYIGLFCIIQSEKNISYYFKSTVILGYLMDHGIKLRYDHNVMVWYLKTILQLKNATNII